MQKIALLYDASQVVLSTFDFDQVLQHIIGIARDHFQLQIVAVLLLDQEAQQLYVRAQTGWDAGTDKVRLGCHEGLTGASVLAKKAVYAPDVGRDPRYVCAAQSTRSELAIPLLVNKEVVGVLDCQSDQLDFFNAETIHLLTLFSTHASIAIQNARLYSMERERARQIEAINTIAQQSTAVMDLEDLMARVCSVIQQAFRVSQVSLCLREEGELVLRGYEGTLKACMPPGGRLPIDCEPWSQLLSTGSTVIEKDLSSGPDCFHLFDGALSRMSIPLISFGQTLGVLMLHSTEQNAFRENELQSLESVADICASSIQNAHYVERIRQLSYLDGLTGIFNRRFFELRIIEEIERARRSEAGMAVVMADIDGFKKLNDEFGHLLGDEVLRQVSSLFHQQLRKIDVVCRYGGEEFAILLTQTSAQYAMTVAEKLRKLVESWQFPGVPRTVTLSAGVAAYPDHGTNRDDLIRAADTGLYAAKQTGRNRVCLAAPARAAGAPH
jgi:diguanylate cyclase (GGDEF)-like protein